jgi:hypothetical protein
VDDDGDGWTENAGDCDDRPRRGYDIWPGAEESCGDGVDQDCDGADAACFADMHIVGDGYVCDSETWGGGHLGIEYQTPDGYSACEVMGQWVDTGTTPRRMCPDCEWAFTLEVTDSKAVGPYCDAYGMVDGELDGTTAAFGFTSYYLFYGYFPLENVLWTSYDGRDWYPWAFNADIPGLAVEWVEGDATHFILDRSYDYDYGYYYYY